MTEAGLVASCERLALKEAWRFLRACPAGTPKDDLAQVARMALVVAARRWDPAAGVPFPVFAAIVVRRHLALAVQRERRRGFTRLDDSRPGSAGRAAPPPEPAGDDALARVPAPPPPAARPPAGWVEAVAGRLPEYRLRRLVELVYRDGLPVRAAGRRLGLTKGAAQGQHLRAVRWLRNNCPPELLDVGD